jgi:hypothetical protein
LIVVRSLGGWLADSSPTVLEDITYPPSNLVMVRPAFNFFDFAREGGPHSRDRITAVQRAA